MRLLPAIFANFFLLAAAVGLGSLLRGFFPEKYSQLDRAALTLLGGLGILGTVLFCVGQFWFSRTAIDFVLSLGMAVGIKFLLEIVGEWRIVLKVFSRGRWPLLVVVSVVLVTAIGGLAEPVGDMNNDAVAYHYLGPKVWVREAVIRPVPDEVLTSFPVAVESQFAALMSLGGERAPAFFSVISIISLLLMVASLGMRLGLDATGAWWVAALSATMPALYRGAYGGYIDVVVAGFVLAAARIAFDAIELREYVLFGIFCGISMGSKYTTLISWALLVSCALLIAVLARRQSAYICVKYLAISCAVAIAVASPCYLRNWIFFGFPIYPPPPGLLRIFPATRALPGVLETIQKAIQETGGGMGSDWWHFFLLPFNLTYHTANFRGAGGIGLAPLGLAPIGIIACWRNAVAKGLVVFALIQMGAWFATTQESRYAIPIYALAAIFAVLGWRYVAKEGSKYARMLAGLVVTCSIFYGLWMIIPARVDDMHAVVSASFEDKRRHAEIPYLESFEYLNGEPSVSKVLILGPYVAAFYSDKAYLKPLGRWGEETLPNATSVEAVISRLHELHVSHVLDVLPEYGPLKLPVKTPGLTLVFQRENQKVYRVD